MTFNFQSSKSPDIIYDHLTDMQKFVSVHPVIFRIDPKGGNKFLVHEKLKLGFIPFSFTYPVTVDGDRDRGLVTIKATVFKLTKITLDYKISSSGALTMIEEEVTFKTPAIN